MSQYPQSQGILRCRNELDDMYGGKQAFRFSPLQGPQNGTNTIFQLPQSRITIPASGNPPNSANWLTETFPQIYLDDAPLVFGTDYELSNAFQGVITWLNSANIPNQGNKLDCTFQWTWFTDTEIDNHLDHAANEVGFSVYCTSYDLNVPGPTVAAPVGGTIPSDIPDALYSAIIMLGAAFAARALALRFGTRYDTSSGDQSFSPSAMAERYTDLADKLEKQGYTARDDYYKGQGAQYYPSVVQAGYVLPNWTPPR